MGAIRKDGNDQFRVGFAELAKRRRGEAVQVDPFLIAKAVALVMKECTARSAAGRPILWNEYRVVLARGDFDLVRALQGPLERDLGAVLAQEASGRGAELVGELRITVVYDEADELPAGEGVVRVGFVPTERLAAPRAGEMTVRFECFAVAGEIAARGSDTVFVDDTGATGCVLRWPGGAAPITSGATVVVGRPHDGAPPQFVALTGATVKVNKQQLWIAVGPTSVRVGRLANANPVHVDGQAIAAGAEIEVAPPAEISLSRGELVVSLERRGAADPRDAATRALGPRGDAGDPDATVLGVAPHKPRDPDR